MNDFKMPLVIIGLIGILILAGCVNPMKPNPDDPNPGPDPNTPHSGWVYYAPVQAHTNPWQVNSALDESATEEELLDEWLTVNAISTPHFGFIPHDETVCTALNCPRGDYAIVHAMTQTQYAKLVQLGFKPFTEVGVLAENVNNSIAITVVNASDEAIFYGGCNEFTLEKITQGENISIIPKTCAWEGIPSKLASGDTISFDYALTQSGTYRVVFAYGTNCAEGQPMSMAHCADGATLYSLPVTSTIPGGTDYVQMIYSIKQCNTNPWQGGIDSNAMSPEQDAEAFAIWVKNNGINTLSTTFIPAKPDTMVCLACSCGSGSYYQIIVPVNEQTIAEENGFVYIGPYFPPLTAPAYDEALWFVRTPFQCYANEWNTEKVPVHSVEKDMQLMKDWLEEKGITIDYLAFIRGVSLTIQCNKHSTDKYAVGILNPDDAGVLQDEGFILAGKAQLELFTDTTDLVPVSLLYKTKFCSGNPWGEPPLSSGNAEEVSAKVSQWLAEMGVETYAVPSIHSIPVSVSGSCDTDSGLGVFVTVPGWAEAHLGAVGFGKASTQFTQNENDSQIFPVIQTNMETVEDDTVSFANDPSADDFCMQDSDCEVKNVGNCCGYYPACLNKNTQTDPEGVQETCEKEGLVSVCGWAAIESCSCIQNKCVNQTNQVS